MNFLRDNYQIILEVVGAIYIIATSGGIMTPSNKKQTIFGKMGRLFDRIGCNIKGK